MEKARDQAGKKGGSPEGGSPEGGGGGRKGGRIVTKVVGFWELSDLKRLDQERGREEGREGG